MLQRMPGALTTPVPSCSPPLPPPQSSPHPHSHHVGREGSDKVGQRDADGHGGKVDNGKHDPGALQLDGEVDEAGEDEGHRPRDGQLLCELKGKVCGHAVEAVAALSHKQAALQDDGGHVWGRARGVGGRVSGQQGGRGEEELGRQAAGASGSAPLAHRTRR